MAVVSTGERVRGCSQSASPNHAIRAIVCLIGFLTCLLVGVVALAARQHILLETSFATFTPLSGDADWEGNWEFSALGADPSDASSERVTIRFTGTSLALLVRRGNYRAHFYVRVDGEPANRLPRDEQGAYLLLTSPHYTPEVVTIAVASGLADGPHIAEVVAQRGWDQWPLAGWRVGRDRDVVWYNCAFAGAAIIGFAFLGGAIGWGRHAPVSALRSRWRHRVAWDRKRSHRLSSFPASAAASRVAIGRFRLADNRLALPAVLVAASAFYFSSWPLLTVASVLALALLILRRLDLGLALVAAAAPFYLHPRVLFGKAFSMVEILTLLCLFSWGLRQLGTWRPGKGRLLAGLNGVDTAVFFFVLAATVSLVAADHHHVALRELRILIFEPALFYVMLRTSQLEGSALWRIMDLLVLGAVVVAIIGLVQYALGINIITAEQGFRRLRSVYGSPNSVGLFLGRVLPLLVAVVILGQSRGRRIAYGLAVPPLALAVLLSFSKGALVLGVPISLLTMGALVGGPWLWAALGSAAAAAVAAFPLLSTPRFASLLNPRSGTTFLRLQVWRAAWSMFTDHLWLGVGPDNFLYQYRSRYMVPKAWQEPDISQAHNILLDYATRMGIAGLAAGAYLQVVFWRQALPLRRSANRDQRALALGLMGSMTNFLAHGLVDASFLLVDLSFAFFLTLAVVQWLAGAETDEQET